MMKRDSKENNRRRGSMLTGPGYDCNCPTCVFAKSQASGDPYDLKDCPKCNPKISSKKIATQ